MSGLIIRLSPFKLTIRPVITRPSAVATVTDSYWSLIVLLGTMIDSSRSRVLNRPATPVRSGPDAAPFVVTAVAREALGGREECPAAVEVAILEAGLERRRQLVERPFLDERPIGRRAAGRAAASGVCVQDRLQLGLLGIAQVRDRIALDVRHETAEAVAPLELARPGDPGEIRLPQRGRPARRRACAGPGRNASVLPGSAPSRASATVLAAASGAFKINEQLAELGIELANA